MTDNSQSLVALVQCHHRPVFVRAHLPTPGDEIWCARCHEYRTVASVVGMYHARCDRCRYSRWHGAARLTAQNKADEHIRKSPGHTVVVTLGGERVSTHGAHADQLSFDDVPPF